MLLFGHADGRQHIQLRLHGGRAERRVAGAGDYMVVGTLREVIKTARDQECVSFGYASLTDYGSYPTLWVEANCFARIFRVNSIDTLYGEKLKFSGVFVLLQ